MCGLSRARAFRHLRRARSVCKLVGAAGVTQQYCSSGENRIQQRSKVTPVDSGDSGSPHVAGRWWCKWDGWRQYSRWRSEVACRRPGLEIDAPADRLGTPILSILHEVDAVRPVSTIYSLPKC